MFVAALTKSQYIIKHFTGKPLTCRKYFELDIFKTLSVSGRIPIAGHYDLTGPSLPSIVKSSEVEQFEESQRYTALCRAMARILHLLLPQSSKFKLKSWKYWEHPISPQNSVRIKLEQLGVVHKHASEAQRQRHQNTIQIKRFTNFEAHPCSNQQFKILKPMS